MTHLAKPVEHREPATVTPKDKALKHATLALTRLIIAIETGKPTGVALRHARAALRYAQRTHK